MKILVACEFSGIIRDAFLAKGHDAYSCDLIDSEKGIERHIKKDVKEIINEGWDLMICHPPCTHLSLSGNGSRKNKDPKLVEDALQFVRYLMGAPINKIALENPRSIISSYIRPPDQTVQPWYFGHPEVKAICLWLKNLPKLNSTNRVEGRQPLCHYLPPSPTRWRERSRTYTGLAEAMAEQWG